MLEIETRAIVKNKEEIINILKANGFVNTKNFLQQDIMFDKEDASLFRSGKKIRIRIEEETAELTYKGFIQNDSTFSKREELNLPIPLYLVMDYKHFLEELGYPMLFQIKKYRSIWKKGEIIATLDDWPIIGMILELEGIESEIKKIMNFFPTLKFANYRLKELFGDKINETGKDLEKLKQEYFNETNFEIGRIELIF